LINQQTTTMYNGLTLDPLGSVYYIYNVTINFVFKRHRD